MVAGIDRKGETEGGDRLLGSWRAVASAWAVAVLFIILLAGVQAVASLHGSSSRQASLAGAVIPRHDPACAAPDARSTAIPAGCPSPGISFEMEGTEAAVPW